MIACDPTAVVLELLDAYRAGRINQIIEMHSPDAIIDCACEGCDIIQGQEGISAYWRGRFRASPALELIDLQVNGEAVVVTYRTSTGIVEALLDVANDGLITCYACGPLKSC